MGSEALPFGENRLQKGVESFRAAHRFLQLLSILPAIRILPPDFPATCRNATA
jgi:hypothetical protein